jgi:hypothetical protein
MAHNFIPIGDTYVNRKKLMVRRYECKGCDSAVEYRADWTTFEVNHSIARLKNFPCIDGLTDSKPSEPKIIV